ncbi:MAG: LPP20 family lipoprotein, partial [Planctomycetota bacterium]
EYQQAQGNMARLTSMESERQSLVTQLAKVQAAYNKLVQDYQALEARLGDVSRLQNETNQLRSLLKQAQDALARERQLNAGQLAQLQDQNTLLQQDNGALAARNKQLQNELEMTRSQGQKAIQDAQSMRNQIASLQKDLEGARYQSQQAAQEAATLRNQLAQMQGSLQGMNQLRQENAGLRQQLTSAQQEMEEWKARMAQSDQMLAQVQQENQQLRQDNEALMAQIEEMKSQIRTPPVNADIWNTIPPQSKLMAQRAAQLDAYRNMAEMIKGLRIDSQTTVQDFVAESDTINAALDTFIKGIRIVNTSYLPDLTVEVTAEVTLEQLIEELKKITKRYYKGGRWHEDTFNTIRQFTRTKVVQVKGSGTVR